MYDLFLRHPFMSRIGLEACSARTLVAAMRAFEIGLARVQENAGHLAAGTTTALEAQLDESAFDIEALAAETGDGGNVAIPFVRQARAMLPETLKPALHRGATSQDVIDTALMLVLAPRLERCARRLDAAIAGGRALMLTHATTPMIGRTLTQQALPISFGAKVAQWLTGLALAGERLRQVRNAGLFVQFGGPVGAHHGLDDGLELMAALAIELGLACPILPWHTDRQPMLSIIDAIDGVAVAAEKIAFDVALMAQTEVAELREPAATGAGGSSSMPHKANPVGSTRIRAAARQIHAAQATLHQAGAQAHERAFGEWHTEWAPLVDAVLLLEGTLETLVPLLGEIVVDPVAMRRNLAATGGANLGAPTRALLREIMDTETAQAVAERASATARRDGLDYAEALLAEPAVAAALPAERVRVAVDPAAYLGTSAAQVARVARWLAPD